MSRLIFLMVVLLVASGCSNRGALEGAQDAALVDSSIFGEWYFHMSGERFLLLGLREGGEFSVSVISDRKKTKKDAPGGSWSLVGDQFELEWPDGTLKKQRLISISETELRLENPKGEEVYYRTPVPSDHDKKSHTDNCGAGA